MPFLAAVVRVNRCLEFAHREWIVVDGLGLQTKLQGLLHRRTVGDQILLVNPLTRG